MRPFRDRSLADYAAAVADRVPTPGGGSASALVGALACALGEMASRFSATRTGSDEGEARLEAAIERLSGARERLLAIVDEDCEAYEEVRGAMRLPRETEEEKRLRRDALRRATRRAMGVPLEAAEIVAEVIEQLERAAPFVRAQLASDLGCAAWCARAALEGLAMNVRINAASLAGDEEAERALERIEAMRGQVERGATSILARVAEALE